MAQGGLTYLLLRQPINLHVVGLLGTATLFLYNFSMVLSRPAGGINSPHRRSRWIFSHFRLIQAITVLSAVSLIPFALQLSPGGFGLLCGTGLVALFYGLPVFKGNRQSHGLRGIPGAKLFIIALVWTISCVCLPLVEIQNAGETVSSADFFLLAAKRFLFITAITIPFDIRDFFQDRKFQLKTIPVLFGVEKANRVCQLLMALHVMLLLLYIDKMDLPAIGLIAVTILASWLIFKSKWEKNEYYYFFFLDGTLLLQFLSVFLLNLI